MLYLFGDVLMCSFKFLKDLILFLPRFSSIEFERVLPSFTEFYRVFPVFFFACWCVHGLLPVFEGVSPALTKLYLVLPSFFFLLGLGAT